jgi:hypothetical protein
MEDARPMPDDPPTDRKTPGATSGSDAQPAIWAVRRLPRHERNPVAKHWFPIAAAVLGGAVFGMWAWWLLPDASTESGRWSLSVVVQAAAAIIGTTLVALTFIWTEAERASGYARHGRATFGGSREAAATRRRCHRMARVTVVT